MVDIVELFGLGRSFSFQFQTGNGCESAFVKANVEDATSAAEIYPLLKMTKPNLLRILEKKIQINLLLIRFYVIPIRIVLSRVKLQ